MSSVTMKHIYKKYAGGVIAVTDFNLDIEDKEFIILVGPSGCGKSTTLRMIAGLEEISGGELRMDGKLMNYVEPQKREIAMVFQNYALYPHMTVYGNMAYALKIRKVPKREIDKRVHEVARILEIEHLLDRRPGELSGGQRQAMALLMSTMTPIEFLILDEHTAALDPKTAELIMELTDKIVKEKNLTTVMVTHNLRYAVEYGNRLIMMHQGNAIIDKAGEEKAKMKVDDILETFNRISIECGN